jgi:hypothetical protein
VKLRFDLLASFAQQGIEAAGQFGWQGGDEATGDEADVQEVAQVNAVLIASYTSSRAIR